MLINLFSRWKLFSTRQLIKMPKGPLQLYCDTKPNRMWNATSLCESDIIDRFSKGKNFKLGETLHLDFDVGEKAHRFPFTWIFHGSLHQGIPWWRRPSSKVICECYFLIFHVFRNVCVFREMKFLLLFNQCTNKPWKTFQIVILVGP